MPLSLNPSGSIFRRLPFFQPSNQIAVFSLSVTVHIEVEDVNEFAPRFTERSYILDVDEGRLYDEIVQVAAEDDDCSPKFGDICRYEILSSDQPFVINSQGERDGRRRRETGWRREIETEWRRETGDGDGVETRDGDGDGGCLCRVGWVYVEVLGLGRRMTCCG